MNAKRQVPQPMDTRKMMSQERLSEQEALEVLGCKRSKFYELRKKHAFLQPVTLGRTRFFSSRDIEKVIELEKSAKTKVWATPVYRRRRTAK